jgi:hypothetical protein
MRPLRPQLGINCGFAINRFPEPEVWTRIVGEELGLRCCQFVADLLNPWLPQDLVDEQVAKISENAAKYDVAVRTTFTSAFTRVNHIMHPDRHTREVWFEWLKRFFDLSARLGAEGSGSHFGSLSVTDNADPARRRERLAEGLQTWRRLAEYGAGAFDSMDMPIPMRLVLDVDHGDVASPDPADTDPYAWLREFGSESPVIHLKQSKRDKGGHWAFTAEHNADGKITGEQVLAALGESGAEEATLVLELSHREREPAESRVVADLKASVDYWRQFVPD